MYNFLSKYLLNKERSIFLVEKWKFFIIGKFIFFILILYLYLVFNYFFSIKL